MNREFTPVVEEHEPSLLDQVQVNMTVYDSGGADIGKVAFVSLGAAPENELEQGKGSERDLPPAQPGENSFVELLANALATDEVPTVVIERLRRHGFIRIDSNGLFASDRFARAEQIAAVAGEAVHLNVAYKQLATAQ